MRTTTTRRRLAALALAAALASPAARLVGAAAGAEPRRSPAVFAHQGGGSPAVARVVVRGRGCLGAEDSARLVLVAWAPGAPGGGAAVYRCARP